MIFSQSDLRGYENYDFGPKYAKKKYGEYDRPEIGSLYTLANRLVGNIRIERGKANTPGPTMAAFIVATFYFLPILSAAPQLKPVLFGNF